MDLIFTQIPYMAIGIIAGITSGLFGIGGGMIIVPFGLMLGISSHHAVAMSVVQMIFSSIFGSYLNYKKHNLNVKDGLFVGFGGLLGASFSGIIVNLFSDTLLTAIFLGVSVLFFVKYFFGAKKSAVIARQRTEIQKRIILVGSGAVVGVFAISLGIGGGVQLAAILGFMLGYDSKQVARIALFYILFASIAGTLSFVREGVIDSGVIHNGIMVGIGSLVGVFIGTKIMEKIQLKSHRIAMLCLYALSIVLTSITLLRKMGILE